MPLSRLRVSALQADVQVREGTLTEPVELQPRLDSFRAGDAGRFAIILVEPFQRRENALARRLKIRRGRSVLRKLDGQGELFVVTLILVGDEPERIENGCEVG